MREMGLRDSALRISLIPVYRVDSIMHVCMKEEFAFRNRCKRRENKLTLKKVHITISM